VSSLSLLLLRVIAADNRGMSRELIDSIAAGRIPDHDELPGVRALDLWRDGANGAMLFWVDAEADVHGQREPVVMEVRAR